MSSPTDHGSPGIWSLVVFSIQCKGARSDTIMPGLDLLLSTALAGTDIAGEVVTVGPNVTDFAAGDKVVCYLDFKVRANDL